MNQELFQRDYPDIETILNDIVYPVFGNSAAIRENILIDSAILSKAKEAGIKKATRIAEYDADGTPLNIFDVELDDSVDVARNRIKIKRWLISHSDVYSASLIFFHYTVPGREWRISFFAKNSSNSDVTSAKRYTFLCGQEHGCRTVAQRFELLRKSDKTLDKLREAFSVEALNKEFYAKLSNWFFWALQHVKFPEKESQVPLIRLITRTIFVWFMRRKELIPAELFDKKYIDSILKKDCDASSYYKAILQNLFFATLNTEHDSADNRKFQAPEYAPGRNHQYHVYTCYRYEDFFTDSGKESFLKLVKDIPFLNGGLFSCLDDNEDNIIIDAFSNHPANREKLVVPDELFWTTEEDNKIVNLNDIYGDKKHGKEKVLGLIPLLSQYNFTIDESSRDEFTVALDPELLGMVFENLLASYNPETSVTAKKSTGSFYTPRDIVDYMVEESLCRYILNTIPDCGLTENDIRDLVASDTHPNFSKEQKNCIIEAINNCKILDPACGSGAFPIGLLQNLVRILEKLDPVGCQKDLYDRKLHLIQNCIYGVDIQPIAVQISKLRCFISLLAESEVEREQENCGIEPLPNLEMHFVAANSLLDVDFDVFDWTTDPNVKKLTSELQDIRAKYFSVKTHAEKKKLRRTDKTKRTELEDLLKSIAFKVNMKKVDELTLEIVRLQNELSKKSFAKGNIAIQGCLFGNDQEIDISLVDKIKLENQLKFVQKKLQKEKSVKVELGIEEAKKLSQWNPFNQMASSSFFNPKWMFNIENGFNIVIGNPPYIRADNPDEDYQKLRKAILDSGLYETLWEKWDIFVAFIERGYKLLCPAGVESFIVSDAYCHSKYAQKSQTWFLKNAKIPRIDFCSDLKIFEASVHNVIPFFEKAAGQNSIPLRRLHTEKFGNVTTLPSQAQQNLTHRAFFPDSDKENTQGRLAGVTLEQICYISVGMVVNADEKIAKKAFKINDLLSDSCDSTHPYKFVEGKNLKAWILTQDKYIEWGTERAPAMFRRPTFPELYSHSEKLMLPMVGEVRAALDCQSMLCNHGIFVCVPWHQLEGTRNASLKKFARYDGEKPMRDDLPKREDLENNSKRFHIRYLLGVLNSQKAKDFLLAHRRNNVQLYPDDWKKLPIPEANPEQQQPIIDLVNQILAAKSADPDADTSALEKQIDNLVNHLYGIHKGER